MRVTFLLHYFKKFPIFVNSLRPYKSIPKQPKDKMVDVCFYFQHVSTKVIGTNMYL